jgi:hypothetical protein
LAQLKKTHFHQSKFYLNAARRVNQQPENTGMRVIVDTNLWVSFLIGKRLANLNLILSSPGLTGNTG